MQAPGGGIGRIADAVGGVIGIGAFGVTVLTLLFPTLLAASAAALVRAVAPVGGSDRRGAGRRSVETATMRRP